MTKDAISLIKNHILNLSDCETLEEAISYFESIRKKDSKGRTREMFDELSKAQLGILFKLLIDLGEVSFKNNIMFPKAIKGEVR